MPLYPLSVYSCPNGHEPFYSRAASGAVTWRCPDCGAVGEYQRCDGEAFTWLRPARPVKALAAVLLLSLLIPLTAHAAEPCKVNVNSATPAQLALLVQTGPALAAKIETARATGPLDTAKLDAVSGIGVKWLEYNEPHIAYSGETTCKDKLKKPAAPKSEAGKDGAQ